MKKSLGIFDFYVIIISEFRIDKPCHDVGSPRPIFWRLVLFLTITTNDEIYFSNNKILGGNFNEQEMGLPI